MAENDLQTVPCEVLKADAESSLLCSFLLTSGSVDTVPLLFVIYTVAYRVRFCLRKLLHCFKKEFKKSNNWELFGQEFSYMGRNKVKILHCQHEF